MRNIGLLAVTTTPLKGGKIREIKIKEKKKEEKLYSGNKNRKRKEVSTNQR